MLYELYFDAEKFEMEKVLILILMEDALWEETAAKLEAERQKS